MRKILLPLLFLSAPLLALEEGELVWEETGPNANDFNRYMQEALRDEDWWAVIDYANIISYHFPSSPFAQETSYLMGYSYYKLGHLELANQMLGAYLTHFANHNHFEEAIEIKFQIAEAFANGARKPLFGSHKMPKWLSAKEDAVAIFDEVIASIPHSDLAAKSLLSKGIVQAEIEDFKPAIDTLQTLIRRFPKTEKAAEAFLQINKIYLDECKKSSLDLDILDLAQVNLRKFKLAFPREPRIAEAEKYFVETEGLFANNLLETARFYERTKKIPASKIYYKRVIGKYPHSEAAKLARQRLDEMESARS